MKQRGHAVVPSSSLVPENDPTTLFTGSGMQPMLAYLMGEPHPKGTRIADSQKCFRAEDIEEVGDNRHTTFFEMLGNWSFGDYFKEEQIRWMFTFLTDEIGIDPSRLYITAFGGDERYDLPRDEDAPRIWQELFAEAGIDAAIADIGSEENGYARGMKAGERIFYYEAKKNWWSRAGVPENMPVGEPGGPDSEMFYDFGTPHDPAYGEHCHPNCDCGRFMEIGNNVFMQYVKRGERHFDELENKNIDFGGGLERIAAAAIDSPDVFKSDLFSGVIKSIERLSGVQYETNLTAFRVIADHIRGAVFMIGDGVHPSNTEQGYFVRRLIRRSVRYADILGMPEGTLAELADGVIDTYQDHYSNLAQQRSAIAAAIAEEERKFRMTLEKGLHKIEALFKQDGEFSLTGEMLFDLYQTDGFPLELSLEIIESKQHKPVSDAVIEHFKQLFAEHREKSRAGAEQKFKGGLADHSEKVVQYHTATHLLLAGLRHELGESVHQAGSNITGERLRFDVTYDRKIERDVLDRVEQYVNDAIAAGADVSIETLPKEAAQKDPTIEGSFWDRYPDTVNVYTIADTSGTLYSRELCGGPHVSNTSELSGTFKITKEESSAAGIRRIKAVLA